MFFLANAYASSRQVKVILCGRRTRTDEWANHGIGK